MTPLYTKSYISCRVDKGVTTRGSTIDHWRSQCEGKIIVVHPLCIHSYEASWHSWKYFYIKRWILPHPFFLKHNHISQVLNLPTDNKRQIVREPGQTLPITNTKFKSWGNSYRNPSFHVMWVPCHHSMADGGDSLQILSHVSVTKTQVWIGNWIY
jgi:hypothetical protein